MDNASNQTEKIRNLVAFWFLGLTNNFGYVVMLSAAHDILSKSFNSNDEHPEMAVSAGGDERDCNTMSTGTILLADILPALTIKLISPFIAFNVHARIGGVVILCFASFIFVGIGYTYSFAIIGVICASLSSGLGEATFLAYSTKFHRNVISTWSSGTGGAGIFGALTYASLTSVGLTPKQSILSMLMVPLLMSFIFWCVLEHPNRINIGQTEYQRIEMQSDTGVTERLTFVDKIREIIPLLKYTMPLMLVYVAEYLINQGLLELIYFPNVSWINHKQQYRWYQVIYQVGVLISRSSVNFVHFKNIWAINLLQWINLVVFLFGAIYWYIGSIWILFALILWEGLLGGTAYVNTFYRLSSEIEPSKRDFSMQITTLSDTCGVSIAGFLAIPLHNVICNMPI